MLVRLKLDTEDFVLIRDLVKVVTLSFLSEALMPRLLVLISIISLLRMFEIELQILDMIREDLVDEVSVASFMTDEIDPLDEAGRALTDDLIPEVLVPLLEELVLEPALLDDCFVVPTVEALEADLSDFPDTAALETPPDMLVDEAFAAAVPADEDFAAPDRDEDFRLAELFAIDVELFTGFPCLARSKLS
jgi:hypothetical protein